MASSSSEEKLTTWNVQAKVVHFSSRLLVHFSILIDKQLTQMRTKLFS